jgi:hypothetical protein
LWRGGYAFLIFNFSCDIFAAVLCISIMPKTTPDARDLLEILDDRTASRSTIVASQFPLELWHEALGHPTAPDAILDSWEYALWFCETKLEHNPGSIEAICAPGTLSAPMTVPMALILCAEECYMYLWPAQWGDGTS